MSDVKSLLALFEEKEKTATSNPIKETQYPTSQGEFIKASLNSLLIQEEVNSEPVTSNARKVPSNTPLIERLRRFSETSEGSTTIPTPRTAVVSQIHCFNCLVAGCTSISKKN
jgi:hypothetical protein